MTGLTDRQSRLCRRPALTSCAAGHGLPLPHRRLNCARCRPQARVHTRPGSHGPARIESISLHKTSQPGAEPIALERPHTVLTGVPALGERLLFHHPTQAHLAIFWKAFASRRSPTQACRSYSRKPKAAFAAAKACERWRAASERLVPRGGARASCYAGDARSCASHRRLSPRQALSICRAPSRRIRSSRASAGLTRRGSSQTKAGVREE